MKKEFKSVWVVTVDTRRFYDACQYSYLPLMCKVFGVYSNKDLALHDIWEYFSKNGYELFFGDFDENGERLAYDFTFILKDENYGGYALYGFDLYLETVYE